MGNCADRGTIARVDTVRKKTTGTDDEDDIEDSMPTGVVQDAFYHCLESCGVREHAELSVYIDASRYGTEEEHKMFAMLLNRFIPLLKPGTVCEVPISCFGSQVADENELSNGVRSWGLAYHDGGETAPTIVDLVGRCMSCEVPSTGNLTFVPAIESALRRYARSRKPHLAIILLSNAARVRNIEAHRESLFEARQYPVSFVCIGLGESSGLINSLESSNFQFTRVGEIVGHHKDMDRWMKRLFYMCFLDTPKQFSGFLSGHPPPFQLPPPAYPGLRIVAPRSLVASSSNP